MGLLVSRSFRRHHLHFAFPSFFVRLEGRFFALACILARRHAERRSTLAAGYRRRRREAMLTAASTVHDLVRLGSLARVAQRLRLIESHSLILKASLIECLNEPRGARHLHANFASHPCIRLASVGAGP